MAKKTKKADKADTHLIGPYTTEARESLRAVLHKHFNHPDSAELLDALTVFVDEAVTASVTPAAPEED